MPGNKFLALIRTFCERDIRFILVRGLAAVLNGAPVQTYDVDLVHSREPANIDRLLMVLQSLDAIFRMQPERRLRPVQSHLSGTGHLNLVTRLGPLDLLATIGENRDYLSLLPNSVEMDVGEGLHVRVLDLPTLIFQGAARWPQRSRGASHSSPDVNSKK